MSQLGGSAACSHPAGLANAWVASTRRARVGLDRSFSCPDKLPCPPMSQSYKQLADQALDFWLARGAVLVIVILQIAIVNDLMVGPRWLAPAIELALLIPLSIATVWTQRRARKASTAEQWNLVGRQRLIMRRLALSLTAVVTLMNFGALARLIFAILG